MGMADSEYESSDEHVFAVTNLANSHVLEDYWKRGKGAAKIRWGAHGSYTRCVREIGKHVADDRAHRICAQWYHDVVGHWPGAKKGI